LYKNERDPDGGLAPAVVEALQQLAATAKRRRDAVGF
jgi:hypothetical protein